MANQRIKRVQNMNHLAPAVVATASAIAPKLTAKVTDAVGKVISTAGGVTDNRFISTRDYILKAFKDGGYGDNNTVSLSKYRIHHDGIPNKKSSGTYAPEYERLRQYIIARFNHANQGLGDLYATLRPEFVMYDQGGLADLPAIKKQIKDLIATYPKGSYVPSFQDKNRAVSQNVIAENQGKGGRFSAIIQNAKTSKEQTEDANVKVLTPLSSVMKTALQDAGHIAPNNVAQLADDFYIKIVSPATMNEYDSDHLDDSITNAILEFVATLQAKKIEGANLPPIYEKIATGTMKVQEKLQTKVEQQTEGGLINWISANPIESALIALVLFVIAKKVFRF